MICAALGDLVQYGPPWLLSDLLARRGPDGCHRRRAGAFLIQSENSKVGPAQRLEDMRAAAQSLLRPTDAVKSQSHLDQMLGSAAERTSAAAFALVRRRVCDR